MSVKLVKFVKLSYLNVSASEQTLVDEFYDLFMKQFEKSESEWNSDASDLQPEDSSERTFFQHIFDHVNRNVIEMAKCEDFSDDYVKYIKLVCLLGRSKLMKYLFVKHSYLHEDVS